MEVNIKIALSIPLRDGRLTLDARNVLLAGMTDEVAGLVLRNNYLQPLALSLSQRRGMEDFGFLQRLIQTLETRGLLDRAVEYLPDDMALTERRRRSEPFTRPELSVLLAYAKLTLYDDLLESAVPDDPYLGRELGRYFPKAIAERYPDALEHHRLRREIIATQLANSMINRGGPSLIVRIADQTGAAPAAIASAFAAVRDSYGMTALNSAIDSLDNKISGKLQLDLYAAVQDLLLDRIIWFLRNVDLSKGLAEVVTHYRDGIAAVTAALDGALSQDSLDARAARRQELVEARCARRSGRPHRQSARAHRRARHRAGRRPHRQAGGRGGGHLFRRRRLLPPRPHRRALPKIFPSPIISTGWRSTARGIRSAMPSAGSPPQWSAMARPAQAPSKPGLRRGRTRSNASGWPSTRSPVPASPCQSFRSPRAFSAIW